MVEIEALAAKAAEGDSDAFVKLVQQLEGSLYYMARSMLGKDEDVADAMQETILKAFKSIHTLREPKFFKTWIYRILINECNNIGSKRSRTITYAEIPTTASSMGGYEMVDLRESVERLEESQRIVVILHYFEDLPLRQVAKVLSISESAVKMRLSRAREALQRSLPNIHEGKISYGSIGY
ncbi:MULTISPECIES: sigma-70 family RNA polymerase sigma factor [unclassified Paenibacillus]|uniref:RNA polymerase sigma factor n=1 Tax=Paenibacillus provencensis TaxID=441151 RepID=A0ABW3Q1F8_9BACL|nr:MULTISPECIES: sigma-70 family RNA polymerase sigma factor [unclassified Paenibacillus]MCM3129416.1 sigma-70 family RNA polymerase sigma factor [Paenibacillus sp. MER 78]SFS72942.1 RNA polymerase sigma-70 factor, ECF subfamily [Paenibacillus sp. 453mf]